MVRLSALRLVPVALVASMAIGASAQPLEKVVFATNWKAEAEHGGYYQAVADGSYRKCGIEVEIQMGGPSANNRPLLPVGKIDFLMGGNMLQAFDMVKQKIPTLVVAAHMQKDPQGLLAHPGQGYEKFEDLKKAPVLFVASYSLSSFYQWMKTAHGFREEQVKPYNFSLAPFLVNKKSVQQGLLTSETYSYEKEAKQPAKFFLLSDHGWSTYSNTVETRVDLVEKKPKVVQCFVDASTLGWVNYLYGDRKAADALIKRANPEMTDDLIDFGVRKLKEYGIVDSGDTLARGIGAMSDARVKDFYDKVVKAGLYKPGEVDIAKSYTLKFVNQGVGLDLKKKLGGK